MEIHLSAMISDIQGMMTIYILGLLAMLIKKQLKK